MLGQWVEGDPVILLTGAIAALRTQEGWPHWESVVARIRREKELDIGAPGVVSAIASNRQ
jgi:hypothetical protein